MSTNSCKHPLKAFKIGINPSSGKDKLRVCSYSTDHVELRPDGKYYNVTDENISPFSKVYKDYVEIPCGQCIGCRLQYSRNWANRCSLEMKYHKKTMFVTLTYDEAHLPTSFAPDPDDLDGYKIQVHSLIKKDFQDFMKLLRYYYGEEVRYFACGEYGDHTARPHYHAIIFGLDLPDLVKYKTVKLGNEDITYYNSEILDKAWKHKGFVVVAPATWESIAYTARYVTKKINGEKKFNYEFFGLEPEFCLMSRKPGIAANYFDDHKEELLKTDTIYFSTLKGGKSCSIPRYFKIKLDEMEDSFYNELKDNNKVQAELQKKIKMQYNSQSYLDYLISEEENLKKSVEKLKRSL